MTLAYTDERLMLLDLGLICVAALCAWLAVHLWLRSRRPGSIYALHVRDHRTGRVHRNDYIGLTRQAVANRVRQHVRTQPFGDQIVGYAVLRRYRRVSSLGLWWAEKWRIILRQPRLNYQWNLANPRRIPLYTLRKQRMERDLIRPGRGKS